jgi:hypothetical protein
MKEGISEEIQWPVHASLVSDPACEIRAEDAGALGTFMEFWNSGRSDMDEAWVVEDASGRSLRGRIDCLIVEWLEVE